MSKNVKINNVTYKDVPRVDIPLAEGEGSATFHDTTGATGVAADVLDGKTVFGASGEVTGTMPNNGAQTETIAKVEDTIKIAAGYHNGSGTVAIDAAEQAKLIAKNIKAGVTVLGVAGDSAVVDTSDGTATASVIVKGSSAYVGGKKVDGALTLVQISQDSTTMDLTIS